VDFAKREKIDFERIVKSWFKK